MHDGLGLQQHFDPRNLNYLIRDVITPNEGLSKQALLTSRIKGTAPVGLEKADRKYYWDSAWWGDQNGFAACTAYALVHAMADGPVTHPGQNPVADPMTLYGLIQSEDVVHGRNYGFDGGATSLAMAEVAKRVGWIGEYRWGYTLDEFVAAIRTGPVLLGINWYSGMDTPGGRDAIIRAKGHIRGGHEILANGADFKRGLARLKQSWGRDNYGDRGHALLPFEDLEKLIAEDGDVLLFRELKTDDPRTKRDERL